jgi:hypothetical protein
MRYFFVQFVRKPSGEIHEQVTWSKKIRDIDLQMMNIIVDYREKKVIKCVIENNVVDTDFNRLDQYYRQYYPSLIDQIEKIQSTEPKN